MAIYNHHIYIGHRDFQALCFPICSAVGPERCTKLCEQKKVNFVFDVIEPTTISHGIWLNGVILGQFNFTMHGIALNHHTYNRIHFIFRYFCIYPFCQLVWRLNRLMSFIVIFLHQNSAFVKPQQPGWWLTLVWHFYFVEWTSF